MRSSLSDRDFSITADTSAAVLDVVLPPQRNPDFLSTKVVRQAPSFFPMTVSPSQSPRRDLFWAFWGRMSDRDLSFPFLSSLSFPYVMRFTVVSQVMGHLSATHKAIQKSRRDSSVDRRDADS